ncbi:MAG TPA: hypothetical protein VL793_10660, partial [Patescibacteria group bacterium]|nr:hypothetical protein [Patescibacteria group bacterium]
FPAFFDFASSFSSRKPKRLFAEDSCRVGASGSDWPRPCVIGKLMTNNKNNNQLLLFALLMAVRLHLKLNFGLALPFVKAD